MIIGYGRDKYGLNLTDQEASNIMNNSGGGDPSRLDAAFQALPQVQQQNAQKQTDQMFANAKRAQDMQIEANQPAIQTLNTQKTNLDSKYDDLLKSINSSEGVAADSARLSTNNELARRGISNDSGLYEREMAGAIAPVSAQFGQLKANTGLSREQDLTQLAQAIAQLQTGNVPNALNFSNGILSLQQQAQQIANNLELGREQNSISRMNAESARNQPTQNPYVTLNAGQTLYNPYTGKVEYQAPYKPSNGGGSGNIDFQSLLDAYMKS